MRYSTRKKKSIALLLFMIMAGQLIAPNVSLALTTGPSQPEVQSFEPVGTTDMVDMFSGDFVYNIPLLDVEGYPVNISYHGGVTMEQEASWVGLGWNINPGEINRTVRGVPDDFNGDTLAKELHIKDETMLRVGVGVGLETVGIGDPWLTSASASLGANVNFSNYRGVSCDIDAGGGINLFHCVTLGVNVGVGSQTGAEIDYNLNLSLSSAKLVSSEIEGGVGIGVSQGYSTRSGVKDLNLSFSANFGPGGSDKSGEAKEKKAADGDTKPNSSGDDDQSQQIKLGTGMSRHATDNIPVGVKNYVPVITNSSTMRSIAGRVKLGGEFVWCYPYATINGMFSRVHYNNDASRDAYGYLYMQNAQSTAPGYTSIMDFTRDKDGQFNKSMQYLPPAHMTYDVYSVTGQGTGGIFRPFRNDYGCVYDPVTTSDQSANSFELEVGLGDVFEIGGDATLSETKIKSGPWTSYLKSFKPKTNGSIYEDSYFKSGGELTSVDPGYFSDIHGLDPMTPGSVGSLPATKANSSSHRDPRGNLVYYFTAKEASISGVGTNPNIVSYTSINGFDTGATPSTEVISRIGSGPLDRKKDQISEIVQLQKDGRKYVYGIPAMNNIQKDATFSVNHSNADLTTGLVSFSSADNSVSNGEGMDNYYSSTVTPSYAHSYLLTSVLSSDYVDVTGDGITDDDLGSYTKFNYTLKEKDYRWRAPVNTGKAQYDPGFWSEQRDDKGNYVCGSREEWMLHSVETRNFIAEFYVSQRNDGAGSTEAVVSAGKYSIAPYNSTTTAAPSYKLDSIKLYNKHDRFINKTAAIPIKTVFFVYSDTLCKGVPNVLSGAGSGGKLTLSKIYFRYGNSQRSMISPYQFAYGYNPDYNLAYKDRWGNYKPANASITNWEYPFVDQSDPLNDTYASAWSLTNITLPSGGVIQANYESDDYAYVQDRTADEMFMVKGIGNGTSFNPSSQLYANKSSPYLYIYFQRHPEREISSLSFGDNYFKDRTLLYYNFDVRLTTDNKTYEQIKGYANVTSADMGICTDNAAYGYIRLQSVSPTGGGATMNPIAYTALNTARYEVPQIIFPGANPDESSILNILSGLGEAFEELVSLTKSPIIPLVKKGYGKAVNLNKSFVRLQCAGLHKKGGGQRVKSLMFYDSWNALAGGNEQNATYGKQYDYTVNDAVYGVISSGVASYEPMVGGDENPFREPAPYIIQSGSHWPPNDPVSLYQETPIGESLYPPGTVGYSKVTVTSIHKDIGKSSQGQDVYQFYTAKDFPAQVVPTAINAQFNHHFDLFSQENTMVATQGYSLIFNDMHGKPKSTEHYVIKPNTGVTQLISYQIYNYKTSAGKLDNHVNCLEYDGSGITVQQEQLGIEADVTIDTREKDERTKNETYNVNLNVSGVLFIIIPIPYVFNWGGNYHNQFRSATVTKVIQQYGIIQSIQAYNEDAVTTQTNELYDAKTGQVLVTSINNEFHDKEYSVDIPAYWCYTGMAPAYGNIKYEADVSAITIDTNHIGQFAGTDNLNVGDELLLSYSTGSSTYQTEVWVLGSDIGHGSDTARACYAYVLPRYPLNTPGWTPSATLTAAHYMVINSGRKNLLDKSAESYSMMDNPINIYGYLKDSLDSVISIKANTYSDNNVMLHGYIANADTINPYVIGERGIYRLQSEYVYKTDRNYAGLNTRTSGLFDAMGLFRSSYDPTDCIKFPYNYITPDFSDANWHAARTVTKWSPYGKEVENKDATGNYSTAVYGYNQDLPVAVAANARQGQVLAEGFEDYSLLHMVQNLMGFNYAPFSSLFGTTDLSTPSTVYNMLKLLNSGAPSIVSSTVAHTGLYSLSIPSGSSGTPNVYSVNMPLNITDYSSMHNRYNSYYPFDGYEFSSDNEYLPFMLDTAQSYVLSYWIKPISPTANATTYTFDTGCGMKVNSTFYHISTKTNIVEGWQLVEGTFKVPATATSVKLNLPAHYYIDDIRIYPSDANMKAFVYHPVNEKLMATLDENNFATLYEYDQEGNLVRVKKETEKGIMTVSESRSNNPKQ